MGQAQLLVLALQVYEAETRRLLDNFATKSHLGRCSGGEAKAMHASLLRFAQATQYHALVMSEAAPAAEKTDALRSENFHQQYKNYRAQAHSNAEEVARSGRPLWEVAPDWPEILRLTAEGGSRVSWLQSRLGGIV